MKTLMIALLAFALPAGAGSPYTTHDLLLRAGRSAEEFWKQLQAVNCVETVEQARLSRQGKIVYRQQSVFDYLVMIQFTPDDLLLDESRAVIPQPPEKKKKAADEATAALVVTNGFPAFELIFHPLYQNSFEYSQPEQVLADGKPLLLVRFRHVRGSRSPSVLKLKSREYPVEWEGSAWLNPDTYEITRIFASVQGSLAEIGLNTLTADVRYAPIHFKEDPQAHLLPESATVEVETAHQHWKNTHTFAQYRHFSVDVKTEMGTPQ
jgi:hypothetical protein